MKLRTCWLALLLLTACADGWAQGNTDAKAVFVKNCAICHGVDGRGQTPAGKTLKASDLTSPAIQGQSDAQLHDALAKGKGKMPAYGPALGEKGLGAMVKYIRSLKAQ
jgi:mono/diheme cytochrome c family protein